MKFKKILLASHATPGGRAAEDVAVVPPHQHFRSVDVPGVNPVEGMEIPAGLIWVPRRVWLVIAPIAIFDRDLLVRLELVGAQVKFRSRGEEDVPVLQDATEGDVIRIRKIRLVRPSSAVILG